VSACHRLDIDVPDQVAVLGVDNERPHCDLCSPPLSSIVTDGERIGFEAALLLDQMMDAKKTSGPRILIPPQGIVTRQSTDVTATTDTYVGEAVRYIRQHACEGIDVGDVLRHVIISRSALDQRFLNTLGRTTHDEILRVRLKRVRELLAETDLTVQLIAERTGFRHGEYLSAVFRREFRQTPREFREQPHVS
jgi:LacI family transcriptional regulator